MRINLTDHVKKKSMKNKMGNGATRKSEDERKVIKDSQGLIIVMVPPMWTEAPGAARQM